MKDGRSTSRRGAPADRPAIVHDFLYRTGAEDRKTCDAIFAEAMKATGVAEWRRGLVWAGVRLGGRSSHVDTSADVVPASEPAKPATLSTLIGE